MMVTIAVFELFGPARLAATPELTRINETGNALWGYLFGDLWDWNANEMKVATDSQLNVIAAFQTWGWWTITKIDAGGDNAWEPVDRQLDVAVPHEIAVDVNDEIYVTGGLSEGYVGIQKLSASGDYAWLWAPAIGEVAALTLMDGVVPLVAATLASESGLGNDCALIAVSPDGDSDFTRRFPIEGYDDSRAHAVVVDADGTVYLSCFAADAVGQAFVFALVKIRPTGETEWSLALPDDSLPKSVAPAVVVGEDGYVYVVGATTVERKVAPLMLWKIDADGEIAWSISERKNWDLYGISAGLGDGVILGGGSRAAPEAVLQRRDGDGAVVWENKCDAFGGFDYRSFRKIRRLADDRIAATNAPYGLSVFDAGGRELLSWTDHGEGVAQWIVGQDDTLYIGGFVYSSGEAYVHVTGYCDRTVGPTDDDTDDDDAGDDDDDDNDDSGCGC